MKKRAVRRLGLHFDNNELLPLLYGELDCHLSQIEEEFDVEIAARGNEVMITGDKQKLKSVQLVFDILWDRLTNNLPVTKTELTDAISIALSPMDHSTRKMAVEVLKEATVKVKSKKKTLNARSPNQVAYLEAMTKSNIVFGLGPAGTGKTFLAVAKAVEMIQSGEIDRIILCRPAIEAGEHLGFLPGSMQEKIDPYLRPIYDALHDMMDPEQIARRLADGTIEIAPLAFMRGRTLSNAMVLLDEAQNTTPTQMKMILTRIGEGSKMVVTGDITQTDIPDHIKSGLHDAMDVLQNVESVTFIKFNEQDVVRSRIVKDVVEAYEKRDGK